MPRLFSYLLHLVQPLAYHTCRDAFIQRASVTMVMPGDRCGVFLLPGNEKSARLNTSYSGDLSVVAPAFEVLESACPPLKDALNLSRRGVDTCETG